MTRIEKERNRRSILKQKYALVIKFKASQGERKSFTGICEQIGVSPAGFRSWKRRNCHLEGDVWAVDVGDNRFNIAGKFTG
jgi:hypothetical protein